MQREDLVIHEYEKAEKLIEGLSKTIAAAKWQPLAKSAKVEFDMILQGVLLYAAAADNVFTQKEIDFINEMRVHGDLMDLLNKNCRERHPEWVNLKFEDLSELPGEMKQEVREILPYLVSASTQAFLSKFAKVDYLIDSQSLLGQIKDIILNIGTAFSTVDAERGNAESAADALDKMDATQEAFLYVFETNWAAYDPQRLTKNEVKMKSADEDSFG